MELLKLPRDIWDIIVFKHNLSAHDFMHLADASPRFRSLVEKYICVISNDINHPANSLAAKFTGFNVSELPIKFDFDDCMLDSTISSSMMIVFNFVLNKDFDNDLEFYLKSFGMKCNQQEKYYQFNFFSLQDKSTTNKDFKVLDTIKEWINCKHCTVFKEKYFLGYQVYELNRSIFEVGNNVVSDDTDHSQVVKHQDYYWQSIDKLFIQRYTIALYNHSCSFDLIKLRLQNLTTLILSSDTFQVDVSDLSSSQYIPPFCLEDCDFPNLILFKTIKHGRIQSLINCKFNKLQLFDVDCSFWFIMRRVQLKKVKDFKLSSLSRYSSNFPAPEIVKPTSKLAGYELQLSKKYSVSSNLIQRNYVSFKRDLVEKIGHPNKARLPRHFSYFELSNLDFGLPKDVHALSLSNVELFTSVCELSSFPLEMFELIKIGYHVENSHGTVLLNSVDELDRGVFIFKDTDDDFSEPMNTGNGSSFYYYGISRLCSGSNKFMHRGLRMPPFKDVANALDSYFNPTSWSSRYLFVPHGQLSANSGGFSGEPRPEVVQVSARSDAKDRVLRTPIFYYQIEKHK